MEAIFTILVQDLEVAENLVSKGDFLSIQRIGNRIMSNLFVADKNDLMILGWIVKELGAEFTNLQTKDEDELNNAKKNFKYFFKKVREEISRENHDPKTYWDAYSEIEIKLRAIQLPDYERGIYKEHAEFSKITAIKLLDVFCSNKDVLFFKFNNLLPSIIAELSRGYNQHGGEELLVTYFVFRAFEHLYRYLYIELFLIGDNDTAMKAKTGLNEYARLICNLKSALIEGNSIYLCDNLNNVLIKLGIEYRLSYLRYADIAISVNLPIQRAIEERVQKPNEEQLELSNKAQRKIMAVIGESMQNKV